jgi:hypothetical protein
VAPHVFIPHPHVPVPLPAVHELEPQVGAFCAVLPEVDVLVAAETATPAITITPMKIAAITHVFICFTSCK